MIQKPFFFFKERVGNRYYLMLFFNLLGGIFDALGIAMFVPLLENTTGMDSGLELTAILGLIMAFFLMKAVAKYLENWLKKIYSLEVLKKVKLQLLQGLEASNYQYFITREAGLIQNLMTSELDKLAKVFENYSLTVKGAILIIAYTTMAMVANPSFGLVLLIAVGISHWLLGSFFKLAKKISGTLVSDNDQLQGLLLQFYHAFKYLKSTATTRSFIQRIERRIDNLVQQERRLGRIQSLTLTIREPLMIAIALVIIYWQVVVLQNEVASILVSILLFYRGLTAMNLAQLHYNHYLSGVGSLINVQEQIQGLASQKEPKSHGHLFNGGAVNLEAVDLTFGYEGKPVLLDRIHFNIEPYETIAIVGETGSGKTSLVNIITGLLTPISGTLLVNGQSLATMDMQRWRSRIAYITQEPILFNDTIFNNVTLWAPQTTDNKSKCKAALSKAQLLEWGESVGLDANIGSYGVDMSGGQRQRLAIARELYKDFDLIIFDEATSALDEATEQAIQEQLEYLKGKCIQIIIAHKPKTIASVDRVLQVANQKVTMV
jgi:subfamily B ATP-binding cassette protein MsbA